MKLETQPGMASELSDNQFDVIVIGAGINGAGIARDAAMRGLKVLLLDKGDIGGGTSSWSTRLIHGGLRYLEHGEFGLVRESLRERASLMNIAPHLVRPLSLLVPVYKSGRRGLWTIRAGMVAYDLLSFDKALPRHRMLSVAETLQRAPGLRSEGLLGAAVYFDAQVEYAERLVLENVLAAVEHGATVMTYARVDKLLLENRQVCGVEFAKICPTNFSLSPHDKLKLVGHEVDQRRRDGYETQVARADIVINAAGPWVDQLLRESDGQSPQLIGGTKGSHLIVAPFAGAPATTLYVEAETDGRPFFVIPWNGNYLIGTTDIRYRGDLDQVHIDNEEIDYLLRETNRLIPSAALTREHILYTYSGVRPLAFAGDQDEQSITRRHFIRVHPQIANLFSIVGGKLTTYRSLAEQTVHLILRKLERRPVACTTDHNLLPGAVASVPLSASGEGLGERNGRALPHPNPPHSWGGKKNDLVAFCKDFKQHSGLPEATSDRWLRIYGTRSSLLMELLSEDAALAEVFDAETGAIAAEVVFAFKHELARTLADCLLRRTMVGLNSTCGLDAVAAAGRIAQRHLGWSESRLEQEIAAYRQEVSLRFRG